MKETRTTQRISLKKAVITHCNNCNRDTKHRGVFIYRVTHKMESADFLADYMILECGGCETVSLCKREYLYDALEDEPEYIDYNSLTSEGFEVEDFTFLRADDQEMLPNKIYELYEEIRTQFITNSALMAGVGLRMIIEAVCLQQKIPGRNLQQKINQLNEQGLISKQELPILDKLRVIGNDSAHKIKSMSIDKLAYALDIINHILKSIYVLPKINKKLKI
ncbi:DUF4145 domain-containing protein [Sediminibacterium ginsengisoli]|uniref:DUF4145 domain-containing protein n=1 Tax=Sediminibacterium ginsengisoli TaxID=413434 RepID=A0A1T4M0Q4_9BACT|nr:DUF4145 domain-containing protein [Sediminibacterium ginsengisoli]SJZ60563.1 protein of unknown function [Sediminibacterium ginsengisoli]